MRGYLPLIRKDSSAHAWSRSLCERELPFTWELSLENSTDSYLCFWLALIHSLSYFLFLYQSPSLSLCTVFDSVSSNIDEALSINPSGNAFVFGDFNIHHKDWLTFSGGLGSQAVIPIVLLFWIYSFLLVLVFVLQWFFLHWEFLIMLLSQFPLTFQQIHYRMPHFMA